MKQGTIFMAFFRVGILGFGGGPSAIPIVKKEAVDRYGWMESDEFADVLALANALPGPIATKLAGYIGYRAGGIAGMLNAVAAVTVPTILLMIVFLTGLNAYKDQDWVRGMSLGVIPVVAVMLLMMTADFISKSKASFLGWGWTAVLLLISLILLQAFAVHPAILISVLLLGALLKKDRKEVGKK